MSKMSEMEATIRELRDIVLSINDIANWMTGAFSSTEEAAPVPDPERVLTLEDVRVILAEKFCDGLPLRFVIFSKSTVLRSSPRLIWAATRHC